MSERQDRQPSGEPATAPARTRMLDAAFRLMREAGLVGATTKEIARAARCSEAVLYKYFGSKENLFVEVLRTRLPRLDPPAAGGPEAVRAVLAAYCRRAVAFYAETFPIAGSLYAEPALRARHFEVLRELGAGPHLPLRHLEEYLRAERDAGRIDAAADPRAAAALLLGACAQRAFAHEATETGRPPESDEEFAEAIVATLLGGLAADARG
ncbi:TetR/AcrR family transcriptional regulator [Streptomyces sp. SPB074]|uniref:TetR/AcrR family transcriptional regulator n=1 Tax=Streptomyces sp. (strain SPB074) TaxID=465543 RepID=UPI0001D1E2CC|nr:TetR/AcrR family transcriptional regulator [Streptomyces sp. SPB074]EDY45879.2 TetR family transcriptional regulator [Streptomyces sp. SPB074]